MCQSEHLFNIFLCFVSDTDFAVPKMQEEINLPIHKDYDFLLFFPFSFVTLLQH